ncbi:Essential protein Yae1 [Forsythia ovata]|uniref:Essential protein Yae1 n=1 Tax=Forsythia ovata TaxID=205694 RepID=A0ABD1QR44_9LAMI
MEGHIAADLYGEALQQSSIESFSTSAADHTLNDAQDNGSDDWCDEDGSSREWESERIRNQFVTVGYREGLMAGQEASAQDGFNIGFKQSVSAGYYLGIVRGVTSAMNCLPDELKKRLVETEEKRRKLKQLHESVHSLSTSDALKLFHEEQTRTSAIHNENPNPDCTQISDEGVLKNYYKELQSFIIETPAIEVRLDMMKQ